jgi:stage II sporulation protein D
MGNIYSVKFKDSNGKSFTFEREQARSIWYARATFDKEVFSPRYSVTVKGAEPEFAESALYIIEQAEPFTKTELYAIGSGGVAERVIGGAVSVKTSVGQETRRLGEQGQALISGVEQKGDAYTIRGSGWGHNIGMSQWGAHAMADAGKDYQEIIKYYFTGVEILT